METAHFPPSNHINVASIAANTQALGPGTRAVIWVQGCPFKCPGCIAPNWIPFEPATFMSIEQIIERIDIGRIDGITLSGGEPMEQASGLAALANQVRNLKDINMICFTGYRYERLVQNPPNSGVKELLYYLDVLIDGPYIQSKNDSIGLRGSSNQRIIHLTPRLKHFDLEQQPRRVEVTVTNQEVSFVGIPTPSIKSAMEHANLSGLERTINHERI